MADGFKAHLLDEPRVRILTVGIDKDKLTAAAKVHRLHILHSFRPLPWRQMVRRRHSLPMLALLFIGISMASAQQAPLIWRVDFEDGKAPHSLIARKEPDAGKVLVASDVAFRGGKSLLHEHKANVPGNYVTTVFALATPLRKDTPYTFSCWARGELTGGGAVIAVQYAGGSFNGTRMDKSFDWMQFSVTFKPKEELKAVQLRFSSWPPFGRMWIDEMVLIEGDKPLPAPEGRATDARKATELFVSPKGDDKNNGASAAAPFGTVQRAVFDAVPGSIITLLPGVYPGNITLKPGTPEKPITLRAARAGRVFLGSASAVTGLQLVKGMEYTYATPMPAAPATLTEVDTGKVLRYMAAVQDVEELAGTYAFDDKTKTLYIHPTDSAGVAHHLFRSVDNGTGIVMGDYTVVRGLALTGFGDCGIKGVNLKGAVIEGCKLYYNGYGIQMSGGRDGIIRGNEAWGNRSGYNEGAQIFIGCNPPVEGFLVENNYVHDSPRIGIRFYSGTATNCTTRGNRIFNNHYGFWYKVNDMEGELVAEGNVAFDNVNFDLGAPIMLNNTYGAFGGERSVLGPADFATRELQGDPKFADPSWHDYRLQSDSPARGKGPDGKDPGAFPYDGSALYVKADGDDARDGTSLASAWKTLAKATKSLKPGQTLYVEPGTWNEPFVLTNLKSDPSMPTLIRVRGKGQAQVQRVELTGCASVEINGLRVTGAEGEGFLIESSQKVVLSHCASARNTASGITVARSSEVSIKHCAFWRNGDAGLTATQTDDLELVSSMVAHNGAGQVSLANVKSYYGNFNAYQAPAGDRIGQLFTGAAAETTATDLNAWRQLTQSEEQSLMLQAGPPAADKGDFRVSSSEAIACAGRYGQPIGPDGMVAAQKTARKPVERVEVVSTTRTSANVAFWTPGRVAGTVIEWGKTPRYGSVHDRASESYGEYETLHTVSLLGLDPDTTYHFRVGFRDFSAAAEEKVGGKDPIRWSEDFTLKTSAKDPEPRMLHVALSGDDRNDGLTPQTAWRTLLKAAREARAGDTVTIAPGRYMELLRPFQTGTAEDRRVTFRAEKPLSVFLDAGLIRHVRSGRSHCIQVQSKAYMTFENLTCEKAENYDNGGYRGGIGYSGLISISGSAAIDIRSCVMDGRYRWMGCMWVFEAGKMPGVPEAIPAFTVTDSVLYSGWRALGINSTRPAVFRNCLFSRNMTGMITEIGAQNSVVLRNCILQSNLLSKQGSKLLNKPAIYDSDYNCFTWDAENKSRWIGPELGGLKAWQDKAKQDMHSLEADPGFPFTRKAGFGIAGKTDMVTPLAISDFILPADSPCKGKGEKGEDIGPRWEKFLDN